MNLIAKAVGAVVVVCSVATPLQAAEGVLMVEQTVRGGTPRKTQVQIEPERLRAEITSPTGATQIVVFDGPQQVLRILNVDRKSYTEMTKADVDRMGAQLNALLEAMKAKMTPEQRAKIDVMVNRGGAAGPGAPPPRPDYRRAGTDKVGKWTCDKYEGFRNDQKVSEVCTVDPKALGLTQADFDITKQVHEFFKTVMPGAGDQMVGIATVEAQGYNGVPVRRIVYRDGKVLSTSDVLEVSRQNFAASTYEVPAGFQKQAIGGVK